MKSVFSCSFDITLQKHSAQAAFQRASELTRDWISGKYQRPAGPPSFGFGNPIVLPDEPGELKPLEGHQIRRDDQNCTIGELRTYLWEHDGDEPDEFWSTQVVLAHDGNHASVTIHTRVGSLRYSLRPLSFQPGIPGLVRTLLTNFTCSLNGWPMPASHYPIPHGQVDQFVERFLFSSERTLPIVVISKDVWSEQPLVDPVRWAHSLAGLAEVAVLENKWTGFQLTEQVGRTLSCFGGAVRIYWPGVSLQANPDQHRLWLPADIEAAKLTPAPVEKRLLGFLCAISATNHVDSGLIARLRRAIDEQRSAERAAAIAAARENAKAPEDFNELLSLYSKENKELLAEKEALAYELDAARVACEEARREIENHRENYLALSVAPKPAGTASRLSAPAIVQFRREFTSVEEAYESAVADFGQNDGPLLFLESARKSAAESPYKAPEEVYFLIKALHDTAKRWRDGKGKLGTSWEAALQPTGFAYANNISQTAEGKYGDDYRFLYDGQPRLFEQHVTKGAKTKNACFSIHMYRDEKKLLLVIGHCGNHLTNTSS